jgi:putative membrane protein
LVHLLIYWLLSALALWLVAQIVPGIVVRSYGTALVATIVIAIVNVVIGWPLKFLTFPLTIVTLGLFLLVLNAFLLKVASMFVPGFAIKGFLPALFGSIALTVLRYVLKHMVFERHGRFFY